MQSAVLPSIVTLSGVIVMQSAVLPSIVTLSGVGRVSIGTLSAYILTLSGDIVLFKVHRVESGMFGAKLSSRIVQQSYSIGYVGQKILKICF